MIIITPALCTEARAMLGLEQSALAAMAQTSVRVIAGFESGDLVIGFDELWSLRAALEAAGVEFIVDNSKEPWVRLRKGAK